MGEACAADITPPEAPKAGLLVTSACLTLDLTGSSRSFRLSLS